MKVLTVTGYKSIEFNIYKEDDERIKFIKAAIEQRLVPMIEDGLEWILVSGQMGVEMWTAEVALNLKDTYDVNIAVIPPFLNQAKKWPLPLQAKYEELSLAVDFFEPIYQSEYKGPWQYRARDLWLVEKSDACLLVMDEEHPGSVKYFYDVARKVNHYSIYFITPYDLDDVVRNMQMENPEFWE